MPVADAFDQENDGQSQWMSGEKKRYRWRPSPILIEENITIDSTTTTTTSTGREEKKHIENKRCQWYPHGNDEHVYRQRPGSSTIPTVHQSISEKVDRILRKIQAWTDETPVPTTVPRDQKNDRSYPASLNRTIYDNLLPSQSEVYEGPSSSKLRSNSYLESFRRRCCSSSRQADRNSIQLQAMPVHRPYSMTFIDRSLPTAAMTSPSNYHPGQNRKVS